MKKFILIVALALIGCGNDPPKTSQEIFGLPAQAKIVWSYRYDGYKWVKFSLNGDCFIQRSRGCSADICTNGDAIIIPASCSAEEPK